MDGKEVIIRTCDIGADKQIGYFDLPKEENPAMGMRALRISLTRTDFLKTQLRALFRASAYGKLGHHVPHGHQRVGGARGQAPVRGSPAVN